MVCKAPRSKVMRVLQAICLPYLPQVRKHMSQNSVRLQDVGKRDSPHARQMYLTPRRAAGKLPDSKVHLKVTAITHSVSDVKIQVLS